MKLVQTTQVGGTLPEVGLSSRRSAAAYLAASEKRCVRREIQRLPLVLMNTGYRIALY